MSRGDQVAGLPATDARELMRRFNTLLDTLSWPDKEALMFLGNRSAVINLTI